MDNIWLVADTHFGHHMLARINTRPVNFSARILEELGKIPKDHTLVHLGDICIGDEKGWHRELDEYGPKTRVLVRGNHDSRTVTWYKDHGWSFVCDSFTLDAFGHTLYFVHIPPLDSNDSRVVVHGHYHNMNRVNRKLYPKNHILISLEENDYKPIKLKSLIKNYGKTRK